MSLNELTNEIIENIINETNKPEVKIRLNHIY